MNMRLHVVVRTLAICLAGLLALAAGLLYVSQFRAGLIDTRVQSLIVQGEIVVNAIAVSIALRTTPCGEVVVSAAVPVQRFRAVRGALLLSTEGAKSAKWSRPNVWLSFRVFLIAVSVVAVHLLLF